MPFSFDLHDRLARIFSTALHVEVPSADTDLFEAGLLDSLAFVELLLQLEQEFGVTTAMDDLDADNFRSIGRIAEFVAPRITTSARVVPIRAHA